jgi:hypothetical protein
MLGFPRQTFAGQRNASGNRSAKDNRDLLPSWHFGAFWASNFACRCWSLPHRGIAYFDVGARHHAIAVVGNGARPTAKELPSTRGMAPTLNDGFRDLLDREIGLLQRRLISVSFLPIWQILAVFRRVADWLLLMIAPYTIGTQSPVSTGNLQRILQSMRGTLETLARFARFASGLACPEILPVFAYRPSRIRLAVRSRDCSGL